MIIESENALELWDTLSAFIPEKVKAEAAEAFVQFLIDEDETIVPDLKNHNDYIDAAIEELLPMDEEEDEEYDE